MAKTKDELEKESSAVFHKQKRDADKPIATEDYRSEHTRALKNMAKLKKERLEREAAAPPAEPKKPRKVVAKAAKPKPRRSKSPSVA